MGQGGWYIEQGGWYVGQGWGHLRHDSWCMGQGWGHVRHEWGRGGGMGGMTIGTKKNSELYESVRACPSASERCLPTHPHPSPACSPPVHTHLPAAPPPPHPSPPIHRCVLILFAYIIFMRITSILALRFINFLRR